MLVFIDSDNAMGSEAGNVDDGFAIAALLRSGLEIEGIASIAGNTSEDQAAENNRRLVDLLGWRGPIVRGAVRPGDRATEASRAIAGSEHPLRVVALGPLTDLAGALDRTPEKVGEIVLVGSNPSSMGRWPPFWPHEMNLNWDPEATMTVFESAAPVTIVPLDVVDRMRVGRDGLAAIPGAAGEFIRKHSERWLRAKTAWRPRRTFRIPDLVAAMLVIEPSLFDLEQARVTAHESGWIEYGDGRPVRVVKRFDRGRVWSRFIELFDGR